jgi:hypothetical protein
MDSAHCIYCDEDDATKFSGREHVIPQAFGTYGAKTPTLKCVCDHCNQYLGREIDQILARETLEGLARYRRGRLSKEKRLQRRLRFTLADEGEAGELIGAAIVGVDPTTNLLLPLATQLQIENLQTGKTDVFTRAELGTFTLSEEVYGPPGGRKLTIFAPSLEEHDVFLEELNRAGFDMRMAGASKFDINATVDHAGQRTLAVHVEGTFDQLHRRALAKIFVNFAAFYLGDEVRAPRWKRLKRFIRHGESELGARMSDRPFWDGQETEAMRFPDAINIRLENQELGIVGAIQFYNQHIYELLLIPGEQLATELAGRFEDGVEPTLGYRGIQVASF